MREAEGRKSLSQVGKHAGIATSRVSEILTGQSPPVDDQQVENLVRGLGGGDDEVADGIRLYRQLVDEAERWLPAGTPTVFFEPKPEPPFIRRESLAAAYARIKAAGHALVVFAGPPGTGKTALAGYLASDSRHSLISCADEWRLERSLRQALPLGSTRRLVSLAQLKQAFREHLNKRKAPFPVIIFDDVRDAEILPELLPNGSPGDFIVTSRKRVRGIAADAQLDVGAMTGPESLQMVASLAGDRHDANWSPIADAVHRNPLAITAVCGLVKQTAIADLAALTTDLAIDAPRLLDRPSDDGRPGLTAAYRSMCDKLRVDDPTALHLLGLITFAASGPLETAVLVTALRQDGARPIAGLEAAKTIGRQCLERLRDIYLIRVTGSPSAVEMHDLTRLILRDILADDKAALIARVHEAVLAMVSMVGIDAAGKSAKRSETDKLQLIVSLMNFSRHLDPAASLASGHLTASSLRQAFRQQLERAAKIIYSIGEDPNRYYVFCKPGGKSSYDIGIGIQRPIPDGRGSQFAMELRTEEMMAWSPDGRGEMTISRTSVACAGPTGPSRLHGIIATYKTDAGGPGRPKPSDPTGDE